MITDQQVRKLMEHVKTEKSLSSAAAKAGLSEKTAQIPNKGFRLR